MTSSYDKSWFKVDALYKEYSGRIPLEKMTKTDLLCYLHRCCTGKLTALNFSCRTLEDITAAFSCKFRLRRELAAAVNKIRDQQAAIDVLVKRLGETVAKED